MGTLHVIIYALVVFQCINNVTCLTCLHCENTDRPRLCSRVTECAAGEVCSVKRMINEFGDVVYNLGCQANQGCKNTTSSGATSVCSHCCSSDLCNSEACGEKGYPEDRGPICYNCDSKLANKCHDIDFCQIGQVCSITGKDIFGEQAFTSHCAFNHTCHSNHNYGSPIIGKRSVELPDISTFRRTGAALVCATCCTGDLCNAQCPDAKVAVNGKWAQWQGWSQCSVTCDNGMQMRNRSCSSPPPANGGSNCQGDDVATQNCTEQPCPPVAVNGNWAQWQGWSHCSVTCGYGIQMRNRSCSSPPPANGGSNCQGDDVATQTCKEQSCPPVAVNGNWAQWQGWSQCSVTCDNGIQMRNRSCSSPPPANGGSNCRGDDVSTQNCKEQPCPQAHDCLDILQMGIGNTSGVYNVTTWKTNREVQVYCDQTTKGGGWTVFQSRFDGIVDFYQDFATYEAGFGDLDGEFWLGLSFIQEMVSRNKYNVLRIDVQAPNSTWYYDEYDNLTVSPRPAYTINIGQRIDSLGMVVDFTLRDDAGETLNNCSFSTYDKDQDEHPSENCAVLCHGAWWYNTCYNANLNGMYLTPGNDSRNGMVYFPLTNNIVYNSLKGSRIMFRKS